MHGKRAPMPLRRCRLWLVSRASAHLLVPQVCLLPPALFLILCLDCPHRCVMLIGERTGIRKLSHVLPARARQQRTSRGPTCDAPRVAADARVMHARQLAHFMAASASSPCATANSTYGPCPFDVSRLCGCSKALVVCMCMCEGV